MNSKPVPGQIARRRAVPETRSPQKCVEAEKQLAPDYSLQSSCAFTPAKGGHELYLKS